MFRTVERTAVGVRLIDQRRLPLVETYLELASPEEVAQAIRDMVVRGAPAIGITAAFGLALGAEQTASAHPDRFADEMERVFTLMESARPTAVNLGWAVQRMRGVVHEVREAGGDARSTVEALEKEAQAIHDEDLAACRAMGAHGAALVPDDATILTHCNAGGLATAGYGTALGVIRGAVEAGKKIRVLANETRPFLQGARLTAWELLADGIDTTVIIDSAAGSLMQRGEVDLVVVGSDRIAANGDVANKIGTYSVAVLAKENGVPFYVAAPMSTIDFNCPRGDRIPIEERGRCEVTELFGTQVVPDGVGVCNPVFDITPARYVHAIVTELGIARPPFTESLQAMREPD
ncbi:MAG: S-methyl-5-thioribose-1-phosphate isomerase [Acidobacteria bacterium]|nr:MAG: S-methyl-5-thioribose-1-phosphate isomerase [Acidobacteriota bacterium]